MATFQRSSSHEVGSIFLLAYDTVLMFPRWGPLLYKKNIVQVEAHATFLVRYGSVDESVTNLKSLTRPLH